MNQQSGNDRPASQKKPEQAYQGLRQLALTVNAEDLGVNVGPRQPYGVVVDIGYPKATITLVAMAEGTVSLYFSTGGGILGGGKYDAVRSAGFTLLEEAVDHIELMPELASFPQPGEGRVRITVLTPLATYSEETSEADLKSKRSGRWPLYFYAQELIGELRAASESGE